jgi:ubiquinone biosynthesis protein
MIKRVFKLFQIAKKLSTSGAVDTINQIHQLPISINLFFSIISLGSKNTHLAHVKNPGQKLCEALQGMGTTFIKLGQFLATRPDIIGEEMAKDLEKLQDKVPAFELYEAKKVIKKEIGEKQFQNIIEIGEPIAAASIAQVHFAKIKNENQEKEVAIKILRPDIEKLFNEELDALMLFAYIVENTISKAKRLKLIEVVHLLREITNIEMDLRFEAAAEN